MTRRESALAAAPVVPLAIATVGGGGSHPDATLAWHAALLLVALAALWLPARSGVTGRPAPGPALGLAGIALLVGAGVLVAPYAYAASLAGLETAAFLAMFLLAARLRAVLERPLAVFFAAGAWLQTGLLVAQRFVWHEPRPAGTFGNPNHLAAWLVAAVLFAAGRLLDRPDDRAARGFAWGTAPALAGLVLTGSRGALVGLFAGAAVLGLVAWRLLGPRGRRAAVAALVVAALVAAGGVALRLRQPDPYRWQRLKIWTACLAVPLESPWTGAGPGQFARVAPTLQFPDERGVLRYDRRFTTTHSDALRAAVDLGWPGAAVLLWTLLAVGLHVARRLSSPDPPPPWALPVVVAMCAHAVFENLSRSPGVWLAGAAALGALVAVRGPSRKPFPTSAAFALTAAVLLLFAVADVAPWRAWRLAGAGALDASLRWNPADAAVAMRAAERRFEDAPERTRYLEARRLAERATDLSPQDGELLRRRARLEARAWRTLFPDVSHRARVAELYRRAQELEPANPFVAMEAGAFLAAAGDAAGARRAADRALAIEPGSARPRLLLARVLLAAGEPERAAGLLAQAERLAAENAAEAESGAYARDLLTFDAATANALRGEIRAAMAARQSEDGDSRFDESEED